MSYEPADDRIDQPIRRRVSVRSRWHAIDFVTRSKAWLFHLPPRPTGIGAGEENQGRNSNCSKDAEDEYGYKPCPKALADLEHRRGDGHGWLSEMSSRSGDCKR